MVSKFTSLNRNTYAHEQPIAYRFLSFSQWMLTFSLAVVLSSFSFQTAFAQCGFNTFPPNSTTVMVNLTVDANGVATLDQNALIGVINPTGSGCGLYFYDFPAQATPLGNRLQISCNGSTPYSAGSYYVVSDDDGTPGGNESSAVELIVTLTDNQAPTIECPDDIVVANKTDSCFARITPPAPTIVENCFYTLSYSLTGATTGSGTGALINHVFNVGITTVLYSINDMAGNGPDTCSFTVEVNDVQAPQLLAPNPDTVSADGFCVYPLNPSLKKDTLNFLDPGEYADNCPGPDTLEYSVDGGVTWILFGNVTNIGLGTTNVLLRVRDTTGNATIASYSVLVEDNTMPTIMCPSDVTVSNDLNVCSADSIMNIGISPTDNCGGIASISYSLNGATSIPATNGNDAGFEVFNVGTTTVSYIVTDDAGNVQTCDVDVTVNDTLAPSITPPANQLLSFNTNCGDGIVPDYTALATVSDNCDAIVTQVPVPGTMLSSLSGVTPMAMDTFLVSLTATDGVNMASATFKVTITAGTPNALIPTIPGASLPPATSICGALIVEAPTAIGYTLACAPETVYGVPTVGTLIPASNPPLYQMPVNAVPYNVTWNYSGSTGSTSQSQNFSVSNDFTAPVLSVRPDITVDIDASGNATVLPGDIFLNATDECGIILPSLQINGGTSVSYDCADVGLGGLTISSSIFDVNGNVGFASTNVTVRDIIAPTIVNAPPAFILPPFSCDSLPDTTGLLVYATDNCGMNTLSFTESNTQVGDPNNVNHYTYDVTWQWVFTDPNGNSSQTTAKYFVLDNTSPVFDSTQLDTLISRSVDPAACTATVNLTVDASKLSDNCAAFANLTITNNSPYGAGNASASGNYPVGLTYVTFTATDPSGNSASYSVAVMVTDMDPPVASCNTTITVGLPPSGTLIIPPSLVDNSSFDACGPLDSMWVTPNTFDCSNADGVTAWPVTLTVRDQSGNIATCNSSVIIQDNQAPVAQCQDLTVELGAGGSVTITPDQIDNGSFDNCTAAVDLDLSLSQSTFTTAEVGTNAVTLFVEDINGNVSTCAATVTVTIEETCFDAVSELTNIQTGTAMTTIQVPIVVQNFTNVQGFQFQVTLGDNTVGEITGVTSLLPGPGLTTNIISTDLVNVLWTNLQVPVTPVTRADGDTVLLVDVLLVGDEFDQTSINIVGDPGSFPEQVRREYSGNSIDQTPCLSGGTLLINSPAMLEIAGNIRTPGGADIALVEVTLEDLTIMATHGLDTTAGDGNFSFFPVNEGRSFKISPVKDINWLNNGSSVSSFDLALIQSHIVGIDSLTNPYAKIAADVSGDGLITGFDLVEIHTLIASLGVITPPNTTSWRFVPAGLMLPDTVRLIVPAFSEMLTVNNIMMDSLMNDFIGVKMGDVELNPDPSQLQGGPVSQTRNARSLLFDLQDRAVKAGELIDLTFSAKDFKDIQAYQALLNFNAEALSYVQAIPGDLPGLTAANFGDLMKEDGKLVLLWYAAKSVTLADETPMFTLQFRVRKDAAQLSELMKINATALLPEAYEPTGEALNLDLSWTPVITQPAELVFSLGQNQPNPFTRQTVINFTLPQASTVHIQFQDVAGRVLKQIAGDYSEGEHSITLDRSELPATGIVYYRLDTQEHTAIRKMIILE